MMRIRTTITYEYETDPEDYPKYCSTPTELARLDIDLDPSIILSGENYMVTAIEIPQDEPGLGQVRETREQG